MLDSYYKDRASTSIKSSVQSNNSMIYNQVANQPISQLPSSIMPLYSNMINPINPINPINLSPVFGNNNTDQSLFDNVGYCFTISDKLLGSGSYGQVYQATDENGMLAAVKCCPIDNTGIPNILEASIMGSVIHKYLNRALRINATEQKLYIIQDLALGDLAQYTRRDKDKYKPTFAELQTWSFSISQAVAALHNQQIIHGDIKASNVLRYEDGSVRLSDFTLAVKKWSVDDRFNHNTCTCTHRPLECLTNNYWNESLDVWSLGCTLYELAYGEPLFMYQGALEPEPKNRDKEFKRRLKKRSINAIIDWGLRGPQPVASSYSDYIKSLRHDDVKYYSFELCQEYHNPEMAVFNDLLCKMLAVDPSVRLTMAQVLAHPLFTGLKPVTYLTVRRSPNKLEFTEEARVTTIIAHCTDNEHIQRLALNIYSRCNKLGHIKEVVRVKTCVHIASKIVLGLPLPDIQLTQHDLLKTECEICHNLLFRLHS